MAPMQTFKPFLMFMCASFFEKLKIKYFAWPAAWLRNLQAKDQEPGREAVEIGMHS